MWWLLTTNFCVLPWKNYLEYTYRTTRFQTRTVISSPQLDRPSGVAICPWPVDKQGKLYLISGNRPRGTASSLAFFVVSADLHRVCLCRVEESSQSPAVVFNHLGRRGNGPGEFLRPSGIAVDAVNMEIYVTGTVLWMFIYWHLRRSRRLSKQKPPTQCKSTSSPCSRVFFILIFPKKILQPTCNAYTFHLWHRHPYWLTQAS